MDTETLKQTNLNNLAGSGVINVNSLQGQSFKPVNPVNSPLPELNYQALIDSVTQQEQRNNQLADQQMAAMKSTQESQSYLSRLLGTKGQSQLNKEQQLGVPQLSQTVKDYNTQLAKLEGEAASMRERVTQSQQGTGRSGYDIGLIESGAQRSNAIDRITTASLLSAAQGNLQMAQQEAERATQIEFEPIEQELELKKQQLEDNRFMLERYDKKATAAYEQKLELQAKNVQMQKEEAKSKRELVLQAVQFGADQNTIAAMQKAKTVDEAISIAGTKLRDPKAILELESIKLENKLRIAQIDNTRDQINDRKLNRTMERAKLGDPAALKALGLDPSKKLKPPLPRDEQLKVTSSIQSSEAFKQIVAARTTWNALKDYEKTFQQTGVASPLSSPLDTQKVRTSYNNWLLSAKEMFNLGVLQKIDRKSLSDLNPLPITNQSYDEEGGASTGFFRSIGTIATGAVTLGAVPAAKSALMRNAAQVGISKQKQLMEEHVDASYLSIRNGYNQYSGEEVPALAELDRQYVTMKAEMNPEIRQLMRENPDMPINDLIQIINNDLHNAD